MDAHPVPVLLRFDDAGTVPNNPDLPVVLVRGALPGKTDREIRAHFETMGWTGTWTAKVFTYHHYHHDAHEALCVARGWADLILGGPGGETVRVEQGDLVVLPAGTGHCRIGSSPDFAICGCYPPGQDTCTIDAEAPDARKRHGTAIASVPLPATDPVFGANGPLIRAWAAP